MHIKITINRPATSLADDLAGSFDIRDAINIAVIVVQ